MNTPASSSSDAPDRLDNTAPLSAAYYRAILHQLPQAFCVGDVLFDEQGRAVDYCLVEVNATFEQQTTWRNPQGRTLRELSPAPEAAWYERLGQVVRTGQAAHFEQHAPFGGDQWYEVQAVSAGSPGSHQLALLLTDSSARRQTEAALRSSQDRQAFLVRLGDELRPLADAGQVQAIAARLLGEHLGANQVHYGETQGDDVVISQGYGNGLPSMTGRFRSVDFGERLTATHRAGIVQVIHDIETDAANTEAERQVLRQACIGAYITVPLRKQGQWVATLAVHCLAPRLWTGDEVQLVEDVAERTWAAVERARAEEQLRAFTASLEVLVAERTHALRESQELVLHLRLRQQQALFEAVQQAQESERQRIAEGLHNGVGQLLYATKLRLDQFHAPVLNAEPALVAARCEADRLLAEAIRQTRVLSHELVPIALEEFGLAAALQDVCRQLSTPHLQLRCHVVLDKDVPPLPPLLQLALYRMAQELSLNIVRHAHGATEASLELETTPGFVLLRAEDNGAGFATDPAASTGVGLRTIRDRVALLNGTLDLGHDAGFGTFVRLRLPLPASPLPAASLPA